MDPLVIVEVTCPDRTVAEDIGRACVAAGLVACANILPGAVSVFRWDGAVQTEAEAILLMKTRADRFDAICAEVAARHPYDMPAILALPVTAASPAFADWVRTETGGETVGHAAGAQP